MCGIAGIFRPTGASPDDAEAVRRMVGAQHHRGPSGSGVRRFDRAVLGHARLAIIDLSDAGAQPMSNEDGSIWITYNGELYNTAELRSQLSARGHHFRSQSDTEVLIHGYEEWGLEQLLENIRGMYAFGLYDDRHGLSLVRDRLGIKPLYVHTAPDGTVVFGSEVCALVASGLVSTESDATALAGFLLAGSVAAPRTHLRNVSSLLAGEYRQLALDGVSRSRIYWDLPSPALERRPKPAVTRTPVDTSPQAVRHLLDDSVTRHLVSDVPVGVFLSGGVDSGAVVACAHRALAGRRRLTTLTVTFDEREFSEAEPTRALAERFETDHREVRVTREGFVRELPKLFAAMDQPTNDGVNTYFVSKAAREAGLTVVLSGLGGDEVFWGYGHYRWVQQRGRHLASLPAPMRRVVASGGEAVGRALGRDNWMRLAFLGEGASSREQYLALRGFFPPRHVMDLLGIGSQDLQAAVDEQFAGAARLPRSANGPEGFNYIEFKRYMHDQLLRDSDVFSMAHSIELRVPLLDHLLVERLVQAEASDKLSASTNKPLLARAIDEPLITRAASARKRGFSFPMQSWMRSSSGDLEHLATAKGPLSARAVRACWSEFRESRLHWSRAWALSVVGATAN